MTTATTLQIDLDLLDELFDNQKKLDDILSFDDEDFLLNSSIPLNDQKDLQTIEGVESSGDLSLNSEDTYINLKSRSIASFIVPIMLEIALIYYGFVYFNWFPVQF